MTVNTLNGKRSAFGVNSVPVPFNVSNKTPKINFNIILNEGSKETCCIGIKI